MRPLEKCHDQLEGCIFDLEVSKQMRATPEWYQNEIFIVGLTVIAFGAGLTIGDHSK